MGFPIPAHVYTKEVKGQPSIFQCSNFACKLYQDGLLHKEGI